MAFQQLAEQLFTMAVAIRPCGVKEVAAECHGTDERVQRLLIRAACPPRHPPHAVADLRYLPSSPAEASVAHPAIILWLDPFVQSAGGGFTGGITERRKRQTRMAQ